MPVCISFDLGCISGPRKDQSGVVVGGWWLVLQLTDDGSCKGVRFVAWGPLKGSYHQAQHMLVHEGDGTKGMF
jgi:hypothetical protein